MSAETFPPKSGASSGRGNSAPPAGTTPDAVFDDAIDRMLAEYSAVDLPPGARARFQPPPLRHIWDRAPVWALAAAVALVAGAWLWRVGAVHPAPALQTANAAAAHQSGPAPASAGLPAPLPTLVPSIVAPVQASPALPPPPSPATQAMIRGVRPPQANVEGGLLKVPPPLAAAAAPSTWRPFDAAGPLTAQERLVVESLRGVIHPEAIAPDTGDPTSAVPLPEPAFQKVEVIAKQLDKGGIQ